jgi:DNA modification methylase
MLTNQVIIGDSLTVLKTLPGCSIQCCVTSPPYFGLRDYGVDGQIGLEDTPEAYVNKLVEVFREVKRVLHPTGTLFLNLGDSYAGSNNGSCDYREDGASISKNNNKYGTHKPQSNLKPKDLIGIPWRVAFALQADGWWLRQDIIWAKPNPMPESVTDRCTKAHEYIFLLTKSAHYYYDHIAIQEPAAYDGRKDEQFKGSIKNYDGVMPNGQPQTFAQNGHARWNKNADGERVRNLRSVWTITTKPFKGSHFAVFPPEIPERCIKAGSKIGDTVLDPFAGAGTTLCVAKTLGRNYIGIELSADYVNKIILPRLAATPVPLGLQC